MSEPLRIANNCSKSCRRKSVIESVENDIDDSTRPWSDLPFELLSLIANRLAIIEFLGFRGVCKGWRCASSSASADIESAVGIKPSFLVYSERDKKCSLYYWEDDKNHKDSLYYKDGEDKKEWKMYSINIPELENATCLASNQGWLLLFEQGSMFFFCPFSRARIDLPQLPESEFSNPVAAFSAPPTSPECIISVANRLDNWKVEVYLLNRGDSIWTKHERRCQADDLGTITGALYCKEESSFYFLDSFTEVLRFSVEGKRFFPYRIVPPSKDPYCDYLPFVYKVNYFSRCAGLRTFLGLQDDASISTCGTILPGKECDTCVKNEIVEAPNGHANSQLKGIWIQTRFLQVPPTQGCYQLEGKVALITGAASGIGKETATNFIKNGAKVVMADINKQIGQQTARQLGANASFVTCDVSKESDISNAVDYTVSRHGQLDIMYNNAGIACRTPPSIVDLDLATFDKVIAINVRGVVAGIKHAARVMIPRETGCILCTASVTGMMGGLAQHTYSISKSSVIGIVKSVTAELCKLGIRVNCISPFAIPTPFAMDEMKDYFPGMDSKALADMIHNAGVLKGANCEPRDIANAALFLASDDAKYISGHNLVVDGGFTSFKSLNLGIDDSSVQ
ncbi:hypothetical protein ACH5RR_020088 [Cinchona calisaya]|uniref:F-box domain-containing protein n=1 Tax=Cinchona calisaya TaxID=153742 RepID=A0ABD2ZDF1_9GENT